MHVIKDYFRMELFSTIGKFLHIFGFEKIKKVALLSGN
jgi:hypothetical protein